MISTTDFRNGLNIIMDGQVYTIVWFQHHKPGKGGAVMRVKLKNLHTGSTIERTFKSGEKFEEAVLEKNKKQYLYNDGSNYTFMDVETYEQISLTKQDLGENTKFLQENMEINCIWYKGKIMGIELPTTVDLVVTYTEPGIKGDTVSSTMKPAKVETGATVLVPLFIANGDKIRVDTRTGEYQQRVS